MSELSVEYFVVGQRVDAERTVTFEDSAGRLYQARATSRLPEIGEKLFGHPPKPGFTVLFGATQGSVFRVIFETIAPEEAEPAPRVRPVDTRSCPACFTFPCGCWPGVPLL